MRAQPDFLIEQIDGLNLETWQKESLKLLLEAELDGKAAATFRELLQKQLDGRSL
jgi:hypothetical protein